MYEILTQILNIPNYEVVGVETNDEQIILDIQSTMKGAKCPRCKTYSSDLHENHPRIVRDLPISGLAIYAFLDDDSSVLSVVPHSQNLCVLSKNTEITPTDTKRYQARIFHQVKENNITAVMRLENLTYEQVESIFLTEAKSYIPVNPFTGLKRPGIDEITQRQTGLCINPEQSGYR